MTNLNLADEIFDYVELEFGGINEYVKSIYREKFKESIIEAYKSGSLMMRNQIQKSHDSFDAETYYDNTFSEK